MRFEFESDLDFQQAAVDAVTGLFQRQSPERGILSFAPSEEGQLSHIGGIGNVLNLSEERVLQNLRFVQRRNALEESSVLEGMNFTVEMETGTGKTYVYLRTIYELNRRYGFKKFVIVVPSVAIREGVLKNLETTHAHFQNLYDRVAVRFGVYAGERVSHLREFACADTIQILVINIDSFAKDENVINKPNDRLNGLKPIRFIQATRPFVIIDEPQNMETEKRTRAIENLRPGSVFRYSATHRKKYHLVYRLTPVKAYDLGLVKRIEVNSVREEDAFNDAFVQLDSITPAKTKITAKISIHASDKTGVKKKSFQVRVGDDLYRLSGERQVYQEGYMVSEIHAGEGYVVLSNGSRIYRGERRGDLTEEMTQFQIRLTVEEHLEKELKLYRKGIKVLSLFFIDRVSNYRRYDQAGNALRGKFAEWFEAIYRECMQEKRFEGLNGFDPSAVHDGYFSQDKRGRFRDTSGETKADDDTYGLIMKDKEKLLDLDRPLRFIFSHSALREGWDNPNVFQICTLSPSRSQMKKRQEIGRGLRLAVDREGRRIYDADVNRLTVIANESYADFAKALQEEIESECGESFAGKTKNARDRRKVIYRKGFEADPKFLEIWEKIKGKTTYRVHCDTPRLIEEATKALRELPEIEAPKIRSSKAELTMDASGIATRHTKEKVESYDDHTWKIPDPVGYLQEKTQLTRSTLGEILLNSNRLEGLLTNPQLFLDAASEAVNRVLYDLMIDGIKYQRIENSVYEMTLFKHRELEVYLNENAFFPKDKRKTVYDHFIPLDSSVENRFAKDCEDSEQVSFYFKLPNWFKIPTPIGDYNPDWALIFEDERKIYFVAETKSTGEGKVDVSKLTPSERYKTACGKAHFKELEGVRYEVVSELGQLTPVTKR